jgi:hypothetical protein
MIASTDYLIELSLITGFITSKIKYFDHLMPLLGLPALPIAALRLGLPAPVV